MVHTSLREAVQSLRDRCAAGEYDARADADLLTAFLTRRDQSAFAALVRRHGPMVLGVCRRVLGRAEDAEDCFQAAFLLLARRADSVNKRESLGSWLYGVAYRMATNARRAAARRRTHEARAAAAPIPNPEWQAAWREVQAVLDEEIQQLPAAYRQAFVDCCLEGKSCAEAARDLGLKEGTVWSRVARARALLRTRLARRGVSLALLLAAGELSENLARAAVPAGLLRTTIRTAAGGAPTSSTVAALVEGGISSMIGSKVKAIAAVLFLAGALVAAAGALARPQAAGPADKAPPAPKGDAEPKEAPAAVDRHGDALPPGALARMGTVRFRQGDGVWRLAYSPDGKLMASSGYRDTVRVWDAASGKEVQRLPCDPRGTFGGLAFLDDSKTLAARGSSREDDALHLWDIATGKVIRSLVEVPWRRYNALSCDGKTLATADYLGTVIYVHDTDKGTETHRLPTGKTIALALSADGKRLAAVGEDNAIRLWDAAKGEELRRIDAPIAYQGGEIVPLVFSPDAKTLAAALSDKVIRLWDLTTGKEIRALKGHGGERDGDVLALAFSPDGKTLVSGRMDKTVRLWEVASGKELHRMEGHRSWVQTVAFSPDGRTAASGAQDGTIRRWSVASGKEVAPPGGHDYWIIATALSPDGKLLATGACDGTIRLWRADTGEELRKIDAGQRWVISVAFAPDGKTLASASWYSPTVRFWDVGTGKESRRIDGGGAGLAPIAFSPDGKLLATMASPYAADGRPIPADKQDGAVRLWDVAAGKELARLEGHKDGGAAIAFSPDGKRLATADHAGMVRVWDVAARKEIRRIEAKANSVAFSPDGRTLAVAGSVMARSEEQLGDALQLWDVATGRKVRQFSRAPRQEKTREMIAIAGKPPVLAAEYPGLRMVHAVGFTPDGRALISAEQDGAVVVWEVLTGRVRRELLGHRAAAKDLAVSADGRRAASVSMDLTALVWDVTGLLGRTAPAERLSAQRLGELWDALGGSDAQKAARAAATLAASPEQAIPLLAKKMPAVPRVDAARLDRLVADLDNGEFQTRETSERELRRLGRGAEPALRKALKASSSTEQKQRAQRLLEALDGPKAQEVADSRAVEVLEWIGTPRARRLLEELGRGAPGAWLTEEAAGALHRLPRP
jgi:RNA polymerase sigma factor (sigma-70 family)